ncbi:MAG: hypothetical protein KatS3mg084_0275 [Candidatus Dojkabacteria bacterium]|nr:MAG: hypothetical protein KatS3mg084_0275 [Candidatus Dojkabacteria bacterium]
MGIRHWGRLGQYRSLFDFLIVSILISLLHKQQELIEKSQITITYFDHYLADTETNYSSFNVDFRVYKVSTSIKPDK